MYVKNWKANGDPNNTGDDKDRYPFINTFTANLLKGMVDLKNDKYNFDKNPKVSKQQGINGQGGAVPLAIFDNHFVPRAFEWKGKLLLFDPSYGKRYLGNTEDECLKAFQTAALDFLGKVEVVKAGGFESKYRVKFEPVKPTTPLRLQMLVK